MDTNEINKNLNETSLNETDEKVVSNEENGTEDVVSDKEDVATVDGDSAKSTADQGNVEKITDTTSKDDTDADEIASDIGDAAGQNGVAKEVDYNLLDYVGLVNALRDVIATDASHEYVQGRIKIIQSVFYSKLRDERKIARDKYIELNGDDSGYEVEPNVYENDIKNFIKEYKSKKAQDREKEDAQREANYKEKLSIIDDIKNLVEKEETLNQTFNEFRELQERWRHIGDVPQVHVKDIWRQYHFNVELFYDYVKINKELRELDLKKNYQLKTRICEEVEKLGVEENVNKAFNELQRFHEQWREIGPVPRDVNEEIWDRFKQATKIINSRHHEFIGSRREEEKKNLENKEALCERLLMLLENAPERPKDWDAVTSAVVSIQGEWRAIGRAPKGDHEKIWKRFRGLCDNFFDKKREYFSGQREEKDKNYKLKLELCEKAEELQDSSEWGKTTDKLIHLQKEWKKIGPVDVKVSDKVWTRFRAACNKFFDRKKLEFAGAIEEEQKNLESKLLVIDKIKALESTDQYEQDLEALKALQEEWNLVGFVPFKEKDRIYKKYNEALDVAFGTLRINKQEQRIMDLTSRVKGKGLNENQIYRERDKLSNKLRHLEEEKILLNNNVGFFANTKNAEALIQDVNRKVQDIETQILSIKDQIKIIDQSLFEDDED